MAVSLAKVADIDRSLQNEDAATDGFKEGVKLLESLKLDSEDSALEQRVRFLHDILFSIFSKAIVNLNISKSSSDNVKFNMHAASLCAGVP